MKKIVLMIFVLSLAIATSVSALSMVPTQFAHLRVLDLSDWDIRNVSNYIINQEPDPAEPGRYVEVRFKIENLGNTVAENAIFELLPDFPFSLEPGDSVLRTVGDIYSRQVADDAVILYYKLRVDEKAVAGDNELRLRYTLDKGQTWVRLKPFEIRVQAHDILIGVESVKSEPEIIKPGEKTNLMIKLKNNADADIKNIKVSLELLRAVQTATSLSYIESVFSPLGSSNEKTIKSLGAQRVAVVDFELITDADAETKVHKIPMIISYQDKLGKNYTVAHVISLVVGGDADLVINLGESNLKSEGKTGEVDIRFINKGTSQIKFVYITLGESDAFSLGSAKDVYIGNIDSDDYETATYELYLKKAEKGVVVLPLHLEYRDASNTKYVEDIELELPVYSNEELEQFGVEQKSTSWIVIVIIVLVIAGVIGYRYWKKKKNNKKNKK